VQAPDEPTSRSVHRTSRATALSHEAQAAMFEAGRKRWSAEGLYQPYDAFAAGEPCRACHRVLRDVEGMAEEPPILDAVSDNDAFRSAHAACGFGFWRIQDCSTDHCHRCCPPPPLSPRQIDVLRELLSPASSGPQFGWYVELTCEHAEFVTTGRADEPPRTARCTECDTTRRRRLARCCRPRRNSQPLFSTAHRRAMATGRAHRAAGEPSAPRPPQCGRTHHRERHPLPRALRHPLA
jgi:hypothetical protein